MKLHRSLPALFVLGLALTLLSACGTLAPGGAYQDITLYRADAVITTAYTTLHQFVTFEYENRAALAAVSPAIKTSADNVRAHARDWIASAIALRDSYAANPMTDTQSKLNAAVAILSTAMTEATKYLNAGVPAPVVKPAGT